MRRGVGRLEKPSFPIMPILEYYGFDIPPVRGGWQKLKCAFHGERNPSATVNFDLNRFHCWVGCTDRAQDTVGLLMQFDHLSFLDAVRKAEELTGQSHERVRGVRRGGTKLFDQPWVLG